MALKRILIAIGVIAWLALCVSIFVFVPYSRAEPLPADSTWRAPDGRTVPQLIAAHVLPDPSKTPGVINPAVTDATLGQTVCDKTKDKKGHDWIFLQRPSTSYTDKLRLLDLPAGWAPGDCEEDHGDSIEDGGHPRDLRNLWCMVYADRYGARVKDVLETKLHRLLCAGKITVEQARAALMPNWLVGYVQFVGPLP